MTILTIDTSGQTASAAIVDEYITLGEITVNTRAKLTHSEIVLPMINQLFFLSGLSMDEIDYIACVSGPGSFTGLRIGAATALGLAKGGGKRLVPVPALDALAYNISTYEAGGSQSQPRQWEPPTQAVGTAVMPMLDARRSQVYTAVYRHSGNDGLERITDYEALPLSEALGLLQRVAAPNAPVIFIGDGADAYAAEIISHMPNAFFAPVNNNRQRAASAGACALRMLESGFEPQEDLPLIYIRKPQAERNLAEKQTAPKNAETDAGSVVRDVSAHE